MYLMTDYDELYIKWKAWLHPDQDPKTKTPINLTNHTYWNLSGDFIEKTIEK